MSSMHPVFVGLSILMPLPQSTTKTSAHKLNINEIADIEIFMFLHDINLHIKIDEGSISKFWLLYNTQKRQQLKSVKLKP